MKTEKWLAGTAYLEKLKNGCRVVPFCGKSGKWLAGSAFLCGKSGKWLACSAFMEKVKNGWRVVPLFSSYCHWLQGGICVDVRVQPLMISAYPSIIPSFIKLEGSLKVLNCSVS